jgi:indolepyruvate ferredoxin oxidoreductase beta subunit
MHTTRSGRESSRMVAEMGLKEFNLIVTGVGGQGSILASHIVAEAAVKQGFKVRVGETFGAAQRGGKVHSHVRIGDEVYGPLCPSRSLDILLGLEPNETLRLALKYANEKTLIITNTRPVPSMDVNIGADAYPDTTKLIEGLGKISEKVVSFDATELAVEAGNERTMNVVLLGALAASGELPLETEALREAVMSRVPPKTVKVNEAAFNLGVDQL